LLTKAALSIRLLIILAALGFEKKVNAFVLLFKISWNLAGVPCLT
jgi:hypothetical protein